MKKSKEKNIRIDNWEELMNFLQDINPYKYTVVWTGYLNHLDDDGIVRIKSIYLTIKPIEILKK